MQNILEKIVELTKIDMENKSVFELASSISEEVGELNRELKIEEKSFGNTYKKGDEGSIMESVDIVVAALAMYAARGGKMEELEKRMQKKVDKWKNNQEKNPVLIDGDDEF